MIPFVIKPVPCLKGEVSLPGDKSIAHRCVIISALTPGSTRIENFPLNQDCLATLNAFRSLGITVTRKDNLKRFSSTVFVSGKGLWGLRRPKKRIFVGDSGTTLRLILGVLAGQNFTVRLVAGNSLSRRPMLRVTQPLRLMGAKIKAKLKRQKLKGKKQKVILEEFPPLTIRGANLNAITYRMTVPSAQVKSALLLSALYIKGKTKFIETIPTRDHTERILKLFKAGIKLSKNTIVIAGGRELVSPKRINIPGDISSAAFFMVLGATAPKARILIRDVSLNPSRIGVVSVLKRMGSHIRVKSYKPSGEKGEPRGDVIVENSRLKGVVVKKEEIPSIIDELPVLMVAACYAEGWTVFEGINELRVKETDRIKSMVGNLKKMGADVRVHRTDTTDKIRIRGVKRLKGVQVKSFADHRTAMSMVVAGLFASGETRLDDVSCISKSFPSFLKVLNNLIVKS
ncbi:MAG: 3-phosphoshikimate 1-carboxyvinyltransferase [Candidatus Omnitrophota bacterium]